MTKYKSVVDNRCVSCVIKVCDIDFKILIQVLSKTVQYGQMNLFYMTNLLQIRPYLKIVYHFKTNRFTYSLLTSYEVSEISIPFVENCNIHLHIKNTYHQIIQQYRYDNLKHKLRFKPTIK
jgi:hypothetical protein